MKNVFIARDVSALLKKAVSGFDLDVVVHDKVDSTNTWALQECKAGRSLPFACFAEQQTAGRGRRGKTWVMSKGNNIAMSLVWPFTFSYQNLHLLPLSIALAVAQTLESFNLKHVQIKWPNDIYVDGVKISGVLIETQVLGSGVNNNKKTLAVVIGIGLNYDMNNDDLQDLPGATKLIFTDIRSEFEKKINVMERAVRPERLVVASELLQNVTRTCQIYQEHTEFALNTFRQKYDYCKNKKVNIVLNDQSLISGVAKGVTDAAELIVEINGERQFFNSAEVSVKTGDGCC